MGRIPANDANRLARPTGLCLTLALAFAAAPANARAGCHAPIDPSMQSALEAGVIPLRLADPGVPAEAPPCPFGICSQGIPPASMPTPPPPAGPEHWPWLATACDGAEVEGVRPIAEEAAPYRPPSSRAIERPPRPS